MTNTTELTFDRPDETVITVPVLWPMLHRNDEVSIGERNYFVRSAVLALNEDGITSTLYVRLSPHPLGY